MSPSLSIIIPNFDGARYLPACLGALQNQTVTDFEVILVDDGSTDESIPLARDLYPGIEIVALRPPSGQPLPPGRGVLGLAGGVNRGIQAARGQIIALLNNDTEVDPNWVAALLTEFENHPQIGMVACKMRLFDQRQVLHSAGDAFGDNGIPINRGVWQEDRGQFDDQTIVFGGCGGAVAYRKTMLDEIGLFDEDLFMYCEDVDLNWRAQLAGYQARFAPQAIVYHHLSATGGGALASYYTGRNTILVLAKSVPGIVWRRHAVRILKAQLKIALDALRAWRGRAARARLRGQLAALLALPTWLRKRRHIQATRRVSDAYLLTLLEKTTE